jgi:hypothetical protein
MLLLIKSFSSSPIIPFYQVRRKTPSSRWGM